MIQLLLVLFVGSLPLADELRVCDAGWFFFSRVSILGIDSQAKAEGKGKAAVESQKTTADRLSRRTQFGTWRGAGPDSTIYWQLPASTGAGTSSDRNGMEGRDDGVEGVERKGWRKTLVYYNKGWGRSDFMMYEYRLEEVMKQVRDHPRAQIPWTITTPFLLYGCTAI